MHNRMGISRCCCGRCDTDYPDFYSDSFTGTTIDSGWTIQSTTISDPVTQDDELEITCGYDTTTFAWFSRFWRTFDAVTTPVGNDLTGRDFSAFYVEFTVTDLSGLIRAVNLHTEFEMDVLFSASGSNNNDLRIYKSTSGSGYTLSFAGDSFDPVAEDDVLRIEWQVDDTVNGTGGLDVNVELFKNSTSIHSAHHAQVDYHNMVPNSVANPTPEPSYYPGINQPEIPGCGIPVVFDFRRVLTGPPVFVDETHTVKIDDFEAGFEYP